MFENLWNYDAMATGLVCGDVVYKFFIRLVHLKLKLYMSSDLGTLSNSQH